jgi:flagellar basal body-associated protein FliL
MAEKPDKKSDAAPAAGSPDKAAPKAGVLGKTPVLLGAVMLIEAAVLFAGFKVLGGGGPQSAAGAELATSEGDDPHDPHGSGSHGSAGKGGGAKKCVELLVVDFKAPNKASGRTFLYDVAIYVVTRSEHEAKVKDTLKEREALIKDRVRTIIAQSDPEKLTGGSEPGLETLRRQVKYQLDIILGEGVIEEVLVPKCIPFRTDF